MIGCSQEFVRIIYESVSSGLDVMLFSRSSQQFQTPVRLHTCYFA